MRKIHIAPVTPEDLRAVYRVFCMAAADRPDAETTGFLLSQYSVEAFWAFLAARTAYVARRADEVSGFVVIARPTPDQMGPIRWFGAPILDKNDGRLLWIKMVAVLPTHKRQGVATVLYQYLFQRHAQAAFITGLYESPLNNRASSAFHLTLGFQRVGVIERIDGGAPNGSGRRTTGIYYRPM